LRAFPPVPPAQISVPCTGGWPPARATIRSATFGSGEPPSLVARNHGAIRWGLFWAGHPTSLGQISGGGPWCLGSVVESTAEIARTCVCVLIETEDEGATKGHRLRKAWLRRIRSRPFRGVGWACARWARGGIARDAYVGDCAETPRRSYVGKYRTHCSGTST